MTVKANIAIVVATILDEDTKPELRYGVFELAKDNLGKDISYNVVLMYKNTSTLGILQEAEFQYRVIGKPTMNFIEKGEEVFVACNVEAKITMGFELISLGQSNGCDCYAVMRIDSQYFREPHARMYIDRMPSYGKNAVVYRTDSVRQTFAAPNITDVYFNTNKSDIDVLSVFNHIDAELRRHLGRELL